MISSAMRARLAALGLIAPLVVFLAVFFIWPLVTMMMASVTDGTVRGLLPDTATARPTVAVFHPLQPNGDPGANYRGAR